jgi:hypothetical protein
MRNISGAHGPGNTKGNNNELSPQYVHDLMKTTAADIKKNEKTAEFQSNPAAARMQLLKESEWYDPRPHAVCTVQTFANNQTGPMMYAFAAYYQLLGWRVVIYDRFGLHRDHMQPLLHLPGIDYYEYTVLQLAMPSKYNQQYKDLQGRDRKYYYRMEKNWGYSGAHPRSLIALSLLSHCSLITLLSP